MTKGKSYNRIVFLTTLSLYLGLVLVGGTAPVLAHSALTRSFDIQNEIEFKDDLDNKPENDEADSFFTVGLDKAVADFIEELRRLKRAGKYKSGSGKSLSTVCYHSWCSNDSANASIGEMPGDDELSDALWKLHNQIDVDENNNFYKVLHNGFISEFRNEQNVVCREIELKLNFNEKELSINFGFPQESAQKAFSFAESLNRAFPVKALETKDFLTRKIYENTKAASENNQVFIVTRLPRGSIDSLLARR